MYELFKSDKSGKFYFRLKAGNGEPILASEAYETKASAENGIDSVKKNGPHEERYETKTSTNGKPYFVLKATNGQVIGKSEMYESDASAKKGIASVIKNCGGETKDLT